MRSVYARVLASTFAIVVITFLMFLVMVRANNYTNFERGGPFGGLLGEQVAQAQSAYRAGGAAGLSAELTSLARLYPGTSRYFVDRSGRDLLTGKDMSRILRSANSTLAPVNLFAPIYVAKRSADGRCILIFTPNATSAGRNLRIFYVLVLMAIGLLCCALAIQFVSPLNQLTEAVRKFGAGDLKARVHLERRDELGVLAATFDKMAQHIESLLIAERHLLQDISHELRSPLARLGFAAELARTSADREGAIARVRKEIDRLDQLIEHLLQITSAQGDPEALNTEPLALDDVVRDVADDCGIEANAQKCELLFSQTVRSVVRGNGELLRRAFENVIRNAISYAPRGTPVEIMIGEADGRSLVTVRDYGPGVPDNLLESIFNPFFRVDRSRDRDTGGTGLGLSIVQRAIAIHHGKVWAENANPGLRIAIELPASLSKRSLSSDSPRTVPAAFPAANN